MQRFGANSTGTTSKDEKIQFGAAVGLDIRLGNVEKLDGVIPTSDLYDVFWANNIFEHFVSPHAFLVQMKSMQHQTRCSCLVYRCSEN